MRITAVCSYCRNNDIDPILEINFGDGKVYYTCPECKKENVISLKADNKPFPKIRRM